MGSEFEGLHILPRDPDKITTSSVGYRAKNTTELLLKHFNVVLVKITESKDQWNRLSQ